MLQVLNSLAVAVALYPILVASSMHQVRHSPDLAVRSPAIPSVIEVGKRQDSSIPYSYSLIGCVDEIDNWPVRVLTQQYVDWDGESPALASPVAGIRVRLMDRLDHITFLPALSTELNAGVISPST